MADVTISNLPAGAPSGDALLPYSQGGNTYTARPSAIVAASSGSVLQVQSNVVTTVVGPFTNSNGEFMRVSIAPKFSTSRLIVEASFSFGCDNPNGYHSLQLSTDNGNNFNNLDSGAINNLDDPISSYNTQYYGYKTIVNAQGTMSHIFRVYWLHVQKNGGTMYMNRPVSFNSQNVIATSSMFVTEIAA